MKYRELVKRVQHYSGFSDSESEQALRLFIMVLASRLTDDERKDFGSQLPEELKAETAKISDTIKFSKDDMYEAISQIQEIEPEHAKKQVMASWNALKDQLTPGQIDDIKSQLPPDLDEELYA